MANYKVIQDIEAEDKLIGPLTLRQSLYAAAAVICGYLSFVFATRGLGLFLVILLPPAIFAGFFAFPWGRDQSTEIWALAKIRFYLKSRKRLWDQSGVKDLVTVTAPKHETRAQTNGLSAPEVQNRLTALASTLDSRGWAVKNVYTIPPLVTQDAAQSDRLLDFNSLPQEVLPSSITAADDIMDTDNNSRAHQLQEMVVASTASHKQQLLEHMQHGDMPSLPAPARPAGQASQPTADYWFLTNPVSLPIPAQSPESTASDAKIDKVLSEELRKRHGDAGVEHLRTINPLPVGPPASPPATPQVMVPPPVTPPANPATIHLSQRDDLNISTIARMAKGEDNEVVISLH